MARSVFRLSINTIVSRCSFHLAFIFFALGKLSCSLLVCLPGSSRWISGLCQHDLRLFSLGSQEAKVLSVPGTSLGKRFSQHFTLPLYEWFGLVLRLLSADLLVSYHLGLVISGYMRERYVFFQPTEPAGPSTVFVSFFWGGNFLQLKSLFAFG